MSAWWAGLSWPRRAVVAVAVVVALVLARLAWRLSPAAAAVADVTVILGAGTVLAVRAVIHRAGVE